MRYPILIIFFTTLIGTSTAFAEAPLIETSMHGAVGSGITVRPDFNDVAARTADAVFNVSTELRVLYRGRVGVGVTLIDTWVSTGLAGFVSTGGGVRARLTSPAADWDLTMGYDARFLRIRQTLGGFFVPDVTTLHLAHVLSLRLERRVRSGIARVGGVVQAGFAGDDARWVSLGLSIGIGPGRE